MSIISQWPPLESDPHIFNKYFWEIGLPDVYGFEELISLDDEDIPTAGFPIFGVIAAISRSKGIYNSEENFVPFTSIPFFIRQTIGLDNACGLIAGLNILGNVYDEIEIPEKSLMGGFFHKARSLSISPEDKAKMLEESLELKKAHGVYAQQGQSDIPKTQCESAIPLPDSENQGKYQQQEERKELINYHFISFVNVNNDLIELDGTIRDPIVLKKNSLKENILIESVKEMKMRLKEGYIKDTLSIIFLTYV